MTAITISVVAVENYIVNELYVERRVHMNSVLVFVRTYVRDGRRVSREILSNR